MTDELEFLKEKVKLLERIAELEREVGRLKANPPIQYVPYYPTVPTYPTWPQIWYTTTDGTYVDNGKTQFSWTLT